MPEPGAHRAPAGHPHGLHALREIGAALGMHVDADPTPTPRSSSDSRSSRRPWTSCDTVGFPMDRDAAEAWPHFRGWRVNYEALAYALAYRIDAVPAPWSGPRRWPAEAMPVRRPSNRAQRGATPPAKAGKDRTEGHSRGEQAWLMPCRGEPAGAGQWCGTF